MPTIDLLNQNVSLSPTENVQAVFDKLSSFQNSFNNLDNSIASSLTNGGPSSPRTPSGIKVPGKIFDPIFGPNVIFGYIITSDFMAFCDFKPLSRVGDLVFVVGTVGPNIVAELGVITTGCMDIRHNSIGSGSSYGGSNCPGQPLFSATVNADFLNPSILSKIDDCLATGNLENCLPEIIRNIMGQCAAIQPELPFKAFNDFGLESTIQKFGLDHLSRLNEKLKSGFCGSSPVTNKFKKSNLVVSSEVIPIECDIDQNNILSSQINNVDPSCVSEHMRYLSTRLQERSGITFNTSVTGPMSNHDIELLSQIQDIKNSFDIRITADIEDTLNGLPSEFPSNSAEAINLALETANKFFGFSNNKNRTIDSVHTIVDRIKKLREKVSSIANKPIDSIVDIIKNDEDLNKFFGELIEHRDNSLNSLIPPPTEDLRLCVDPPEPTRCKDLAELQNLVNDGVKNIIELVNGKKGQAGLIAKALEQAGVKDLKIATGAAGMNPIDSNILFRKSTLDKINRSILQTLKVKAYLAYSEATSLSLVEEWGLFQALFSASPRDGFGNLINPAPLTALLTAIQAQCITLPQKEIKQFALEVVELGSDIRNLNFISMDPTVVGTNPPLSVMASNPAVLIPSSNIGSILLSSQAAIEQSQQNALLILNHLSTIIPDKEKALTEMKAYAKNVLQMGIDSLKSLQNCLPPLPCIDFKGLFNFQTSFSIGVGLPFNIKIPVLDLSFPNVDFQVPLVFPTLVAPTGFRAAINIGIPNLRLPRIPTPPLFPPNITIPTIRLPQINIPFDLSRLFGFLPKFPKSFITLDLPRIALPRLPNIIIPPINIKFPKFNMRFGGFPFPKLDIRLPRFPINFSIKVPLTFNIKIPIPGIDLKLPRIALPFIKIPSFILNIPKLNIPFSGGISVGVPKLPTIAIPFPSITIPSLCGDDGKSVSELIDDGKNMFNRLMNIGASAGRPLSVANCSLWVSPHFRGWIAPIPCSAFATDGSKCICLT